MKGTEKQIAFAQDLIAKVRAKIAGGSARYQEVMSHYAAALEAIEAIEAGDLERAAAAFEKAAGWVQDCIVQGASPAIDAGRVIEYLRKQAA